MIIQIHHIPSRQHWVTSVRYPSENIVRVYDSKRTHCISNDLVAQIVSIYGKDIRIVYPPMTQQLPGSVDCGVFAIATATDLCVGVDPSRKDYVREGKVMRLHLCGCLARGRFTPFP